MNSMHHAHLTDSVIGSTVVGSDRLVSPKPVEYGPLSSAVVAVIRNDRSVTTPAASADDALTLSENFNAEIDAWARQALSRSGFGDF